MNFRTLRENAFAAVESGTTDEFMGRAPEVNGKWAEAHRIGTRYWIVDCASAGSGVRTIRVFPTTEDRLQDFVDLIPKAVAA